VGERMRIQFDLPDEKVEELDTLMDVIGVSTRKDLFNNALTLLEWAVKEIKNDPDRVIASVNEENQLYKEVDMAAFSNARSKSRALNKRKISAQ
jgi:hypothetical protein